MTQEKNTQVAFESTISYGPKDQALAEIAAQLIYHLTAVKSAITLLPRTCPALSDNDDARIWLEMAETSSREMLDIINYQMKDVLVERLRNERRW